MHRLISVVITLLLSFVLSTKLAFAQAAPVSLLEQKQDGAKVEKISSNTLASLGDPFFKLVLKDHANVTNLAEIEKLIKGEQGEEQTFVVDETIVDTRPKIGDKPATRRAVLTFTGENQGENLDPNVMLSVIFNSENFPDVQPIEALGWDGQRGRYNYYKLDDQGTPGRLSWKFRNSSIQADLLQPAQRSGTCLQCHVNGAPVMKELTLPWNNWRSNPFQASYLKFHWNVGQNSPRIDPNLRDAEPLEINFIAPAINEFNNKRIDESIARNNGSPVTNPNGSQQITNGKRLLRPLFVTTEVNLISSDQQVGNLHPFESSSAPEPFADVKIPNTFFLNANLIQGNAELNVQGLQIRDLKFSDIAAVKPEEYRQLVNRSGVKLNGKAGDANFAWFVPEPSHVDNSMIDQLLLRGVVTPEFVAAVMAIDLDKPVFSLQRQKLLRFIPDQFSFQPLQFGTDPLSVKRHPDDLTQKVIAALAQKNPTSNSAEGQFLAILRNNNPLQVLKKRIQQYSNSIDQKLNNKSNPKAREAELKRLYDLAIARRREVLNDPVLKALDETKNKLFPLPDIGIASATTAQ